MKLKYKKIILLTTMSTMGIGMLTLSISSEKVNSTTTVEGNAEAGTKQAKVLLASTDIDTPIDAGTQDESIVLTPIPTLTPTPTPIPNYDLEIDAYPAVNELIKQYYKALIDCDVKKLKSLVNDSSIVDTEEELQSFYGMFEDYINIKCYTKKGPIEGSYIVYVYYETKFPNINTAAPGLIRDYVITGEDGNLKLFYGEVEDEIKEYIDARNQDEDVLALQAETDKKYKKAQDKDEDLQELAKIINETTSSNEKESKDSSKE